MMSKIQIIDTLFAFYYDNPTPLYFGEPVSQIQHAEQCAFFAAKAFPDKPEFCIAALLHDIGHLCEVQAPRMFNHLNEDYGAMHHEQLGANYLRACGFSEIIAELVSGHVNAKRYNIFLSQTYNTKLSSASQFTLSQQGGAMSKEEARLFEQDPLFKEKRLLRTWDERAKEPDLKCPTFESYRELLCAQLS